MAYQTMREIEKIYGMDEFKALAQKLCSISENRKTLTASQIRLPNYLFAVAPGCGATTHLQLLVKLLAEMELFRFEGDKKCFEWIIDRNAFEREGSFDRLLNQLKAAAGFRHSFYGAIGIDINDWCENPQSQKLNRLLDFCEDMREQILFVFIIDLYEEDTVSAVMNRLSREMPVELVHFPMPTAQQLMLSMNDFISDRGFSLTAEAKQVLETVMPRLMKAKGFDGLQTLDNLADEIVYQFCSGGKVSSPGITMDALAFIERSGGYIDRLECVRPDGRENRRIGF